MKNVFRFLFLFSLLSTFSCTKENSAFDSAESSGGDFGGDNLSLPECNWVINVQGFQVGCPQTLLSSSDGTVTSSPPPRSTFVEVFKFVQGVPTFVTSFTVNEGQSLGPIPIKIKAVSGKIVFSGEAGVNISVSTPAGVKDFPFTPNLLRNKRRACGEPIFTTKTSDYGIGGLCDITNE